MQLHLACQISDNMALVLLPVNKESQDELLKLEQELEKQKEFEHFVIEDFCPSDPCKNIVLLKIYSLRDFPLNQQC